MNSQFDQLEQGFKGLLNGFMLKTRRNSVRVDSFTNNPVDRELASCTPVSSSFFLQGQSAFCVGKAESVKHTYIAQHHCRFVVFGQLCNQHFRSSFTVRRQDHRHDQWKAMMILMFLQ